MGVPHALEYDTATTQRIFGHSHSQNILLVIYPSTHLCKPLRLVNAGEIAAVSFCNPSSFKKWGAIAVPLKSKTVRIHTSFKTQGPEENGQGREGGGGGGRKGVGRCWTFDGLDHGIGLHFGLCAECRGLRATALRSSGLHMT